MSALCVRVVNDTGEALELDDMSTDPGRWQAPKRIAAHSTAVLRSRGRGKVPGLSYFVGGDPDRPVYIHIREREIEVWATPVCRTVVDTGNEPRVWVGPAARHVAA